MRRWQRDDRVQRLVAAAVAAAVESGAGERAGVGGDRGEAGEAGEGRFRAFWLGPGDEQRGGLVGPRPRRSEQRGGECLQAVGELCLTRPCLGAELAYAQGE
jgi:hypothetical protein